MNIVKSAIVLGMVVVGICKSGESRMETNAATIQEVQVTFAPPLQRGDVNLDGKVDLKDAQLALQAATKQVELSSIAIAQGDLNGNGMIDLTDAQSIMKIAMAINN